MSIRKAFRSKTEIVSLKTMSETLSFVRVQSDDLILTTKNIYDRFLQSALKDNKILFREDYGTGQILDTTVDKIAKDAGASYKRVIGIGPGSVMELAKLLSLEKFSPFADIYHQRFALKKIRDLILIPSTPGTGTEVTPYCAVVMSSLGVQTVLNDDCLYADYALLCPELLEDLPFKAMASSSFDSFVHAFESYLSPLATPFSKTMSLKAMEIIIKAWSSIACNGAGALNDNIALLQQAGTMAGIGYANAGCAAIHATAYPLAVRLSLSHGESNYITFFEIVKIYKEKKAIGSLDDIESMACEILDCKKDESFAYLERLCNNILSRKKLSALGMKESQILEFTDMVMTRQHMLIANGYVQLSPGEIADVYKNLF